MHPVDPSAFLLTVAPMMDWTDRHCRYFHRLLSPHARLYTEMVTSAALVRGNQIRLLEHSHEEHPVALQLGGSDPVELAKTFITGSLESGRMLFAPIPNFIFTRDIGIVINEYVLLNKPASCASRPWSASASGPWPRWWTSR